MYLLVQGVLPTPAHQGFLHGPGLLTIQAKKGTQGCHSCRGELLLEHTDELVNGMLGDLLRTIHYAKTTTQISLGHLRYIWVCPGGYS